MYFILSRKKIILFCLSMALLGILTGSIFAAVSHAGYSEKKHLSVVIDAGHGAFVICFKNSTLFRFP